MTTSADLKKTELARLRDMGIEPQRIIVREGCPIAFVDRDTASRIIDTMVGNRYTMTGMFIDTEAETVPGTSVVLPVYCAMDNSDGCCWVEEFYHETTAISWILGNGDTDRLHLTDIRRLDSYKGLESLVPLGDDSRKDERLALIKWLRDQANLYGGNTE